MGILSGVISYLFGLALNLLDAAINGFLGALGFNLDTFEQYFPAAASYHEVIVGFAVGLLLILFLFQLFKNFGIVLDMEAEEPLQLLGKTAIFLGMIVCSRSIINLILDLMADPYTIFLNAAPTPYQFELVTLVTAMFNSVFSNPFTHIVAMILMLVMGWQFLKLTVECVERYIVFYFALYCAPVVFATGAFKSTAQIFKSWCRLVGSQAMLLLINIWSIKLFLSFMPAFEKSGADIVFTFLIGYAFLKFAQKADTLLRILGLNTASTGDMARSLGGTIAGIAMTIRTAGHMAQGVASAVGQRFQGTGGADGKGGESGGGKRGESGDEVSGMGGPQKTPPGPPGGGTPPTGEDTASGITAFGISTAKQGFVTDVMRAARAKMEGGPFTSPVSDGSDSSNSDAGSNASFEEKTNQGQEDSETQDGKIRMGRDGNSPKTVSKDFRNLDEETLEGLSNLAHGLPHDKFDEEKGTFSGGGFPKFTGEEANIIGASQLTPADGVERSMVKMPDGTIGTIYRNTETGESQMVQFSSVDNGVMQGTISRIDSETGKAGENFAFKAVHSSVPGAETFSSHTVPVHDPSGGAYHVATDADMSAFSVAHSAQPPTVGSAYTPGGASRMATPTNTSGNSVEAIRETHAVGNTVGVVSSETPTVSAAMGAVHPSGSAQAPISGGSGMAASSVGTVSGAANITGSGENSRQEVYHETSLQDETPMPVQNGTETPPVQTGMRPPQNQVRRFSKNNPANLEVFRLDESKIEAFDKQGSDTESGPSVTPLKK